MASEHSSASASASASASRSMSLPINPDLLLGAGADLDDDESKTIVILKPHITGAANQAVRQMIKSCRSLHIVSKQNGFLPYATWMVVLADDMPDLQSLDAAANYLASGPVTVLVVHGEDIYDTLGDLCGPESPAVAKLHFPDSIRARFGVDAVKNAIWFSRKIVVYRVLYETFFLVQSTIGTVSEARRDNNNDNNNNNNGSQHERDAKKNVSSMGSSAYSQASLRRTLMIIKPHVRQEADIAVIKQILREAGIQIKQEKSRFLPLEAWILAMKHDSPDRRYLKKCAKHLCSSAVIAFAIEADDVFDLMLEVGGSHEPKIARRYFPESIRAKYGVNPVKNAIWWAKNPKIYKATFAKFFFEEHETSSDDIGSSSDGAHAQPDTDTPIPLTVQKSVILVKPHFVENVKVLIDTLNDHGVQVLQKRYKFVPREAADYLLEVNESQNESEKQAIFAELKSDEAIALQVCRVNVFATLNTIIGSADIVHAKEHSPQSIRAIYAENRALDCVYYTKNVEEYNVVFDHFFFEDRDPTPVAHSANMASGHSGYSLHSEHSGRTAHSSLTQMSVKSRTKYAGLAPVNVMIIKPHAFGHRTAIEEMLNTSGFKVLTRRHALLHESAIVAFLKSNEFFMQLQVQQKQLIVDQMCSGSVCVFCLGDTQNPEFSQMKHGFLRSLEIAKEIAQKYGMDPIRDAVYMCQTIREMQHQRKFFILNRAYLKHETKNESRQHSFMIIKPHAVKFRKAIVAQLRQFEFSVVVKKKVMPLEDQSIVEDFFEPYYGTEFLFDQLVSHMNSGPFLILIVSRDNCINAMKQFCPQLQSNFAEDDTMFVQNAVYVSRNESDFWRDRSFFFYHAQSDVQFSDMGSVTFSQSVQSFEPNGFKSGEPMVLQRYDKETRKRQKRRKRKKKKRRRQNKNSNSNSNHNHNAVGADGMSSISRQRSLRSDANTNTNSSYYYESQTPTLDLHSKPSASADAYEAQSRSSLKEVKERKADNDAAMSASASTPRKQQPQPQPQPQPQTRLSPIEEGILIIKPHAIQHASAIERRLLENDFYIKTSIKKKYHRSVFESIYPAFNANPFLDNLCNVMATDSVIVFHVYRVSALSVLAQLVGPTDPNIAHQNSPHSFRALYGKDMTDNCCHTPDTEVAVQKEKFALFGADYVDNTDKWNENSVHSKTEQVLIVIKPMATQKYKDLIRGMIVGNGFKILSEKLERLPISKFDQIQIDCENAQRKRAIEYLASGECVFMVIQKMNAYENLIEIAGNRDPQRALKENPDTIRAIYGTNAVQNAIEVSLSVEIFQHNVRILFNNNGALQNNGYQSYGNSESTSPGYASGVTLDASDIEIGEIPHIQPVVNNHDNNNNNDDESPCSFVLIKPHIHQKQLDSIKNMLQTHGFRIDNERKSFEMTFDDCMEMFGGVIASDILDLSCQQCSAGPMTALLVSKANVFKDLKHLMGDSNPNIARVNQRNSIRALFGLDRICNACYYAPDERTFDNLFFKLFADDDSSSSGIENLINNKAFQSRT